MFTVQVFQRNKICVIRCAWGGRGTKTFREKTKLGIFSQTGEHVRHTEGGEHEPDGDAEGGPHVPPALGRGERVHRYTEQRHQHLRQDQVHQEQVEVCPKLKTNIKL